jgi:hypothetical protein
MLLRCENLEPPMSQLGHFRPSSAGFAYRPLPLSTSRPRPFYEYTPIPHLVRWGRAHGAGDPIRQRDSLGRQENVRLSKFDQS